MNQNKFILVVPVYNAEQWIMRCIDSILSQDYDNYELIVIDDHSTDNTWEMIEDYGINKYRNEKRSGSGLANIIKGIQRQSKDPEDIIVTVDGDDYLAGDFVLPFLDRVYDGTCWMTYGKFHPLSGGYPDYGELIKDTKTYRKNGSWVTSHLRTFKRWLWDKINDNDLRDRDGEYFKVAWDFAFMYPLIEMAGSHVCFIDHVLYIYNDMNPANDGKIDPVRQIATANYILNKPSYKEL